MMNNDPKMTELFAGKRRLYYSVAGITITNRLLAKARLVRSSFIPMRRLVIPIK